MVELAGKGRQYQNSDITGQCMQSDSVACSWTCEGDTHLAVTEPWRQTAETIIS